MTEYKALSASECARRILDLERPIVVMHVRPDGDTVGTAAALMAVFHKLGKAPLYACSDPIPERLEFLLKDFREAYRYELDGSAIVTVDIPTKEQIGELYDYFSDISLMIDHHEVGTPFADNLIVSGASSAGEVLMSVIEELVTMGKIQLTPDIASPIYAAISSDTGCFRYSNATPDTLRRSAVLIESGIDYENINHKLFNSKTPKQIRAEGFVADRIKTAFGGRVAYATVTKRDRQSQGASLEHFETAIDVVRSVEFVEISFVVKEMDNGEFKASLRSTGKDVAAIASAFSGGGHIRASGCTVAASSIGNAAELLLEKIGQTYYEE